MTLEYVNYILWGPWQNQEYPFIIHTFKMNMETWVELYSQHYAHELLFISRIFVGDTIHHNIIP